MEVVPQLGIKFDMAFIDGNKREYVNYYEMVMQYMNKGGFILADNTLWDGHVLEQPAEQDEQTKGIMAFNNFVAKDTRVEKVILPIRDGISIIRVKS